MSGFRQPGGIREVIVAPTDLTLTNYDLGKIFTNRGAAGSVTLTLPAPSGDNKGGGFRILSAANQNLVLSCASSIATDNSLTSSSVALSTASHKIGGGFDVVSDGTTWFVLPLIFSTQTATVA